MRLVAVLVGLVVTALVAVLVFRAVSGQDDATLSALTATTVAPAAPVLPGPGLQPMPLETTPEAVRPGVPPILQPATAAACAADRATLQAAIDAFVALDGVVPADEQAIVDAGLLREPSLLWDVKDGALVAQDPVCG